MERGALRQQVLWIVREQGPCTTADVCSALREEREISVNAVQTVLNRLVTQGILTRTGTRRHYRYEAQPSEEAVKQRASRAAAELLSESGEQGLTHFLDAVDRLQPDALHKLERLLEQRRTKQEKP